MGSQSVTMYLLTEWEGQTRKYLAGGNGIRTKCGEVWVPWLGAKYFSSSNLNSVNKHFITWPLHFSLFFPFFFFSGNKIHYRNVHLITHFDQKLGIYKTTKLFQYTSHKEPYAILAGSDRSFQPYLCHHLRPSCRDFLHSFAMKACAGRYRSYDNISCHNNNCCAVMCICAAQEAHSWIQEVITFPDKQMHCGLHGTRRQMIWTGFSMIQN